jgi:hypothetical protein
VERHRRHDHVEVPRHEAHVLGDGPHAELRVTPTHRERSRSPVISGFMEIFGVTPLA